MKRESKIHIERSQDLSTTESRDIEEQYNAGNVLKGDKPGENQGQPLLIDFFVTDCGIDFVHVRRERLEFYLLRVLDEMRVR